MMRAGLWTRRAVTGVASWVAGGSIALGLMASLAFAEGPKTTQRPVARDADQAAVSPIAPASVSPDVVSDQRPIRRPFGVLVRGLRQNSPSVAAVWLAAAPQGLPLPTLMMLDQNIATPAPLTPRYRGLGADGIAPGPLAILSSVKQPTGRLAAQEQRQIAGNAVSVDVGRLSRLFASTLSNPVRITRPNVVVPDETLLSAAPQSGPRPDARPQVRPGTEVLAAATAPLQPVTEASSATVAVVQTGPAPLRPVARPALPPRAQVIPLVGINAARPGGAGAAIAPPILSEQAVALAVLPPARPEGITQAYQAARAERARGSVCGTPDIQGQAISRVGNGGGCGIAEPVRITSVSGVRLSTPATIDCTTAQALNRWVRDGARPALGGSGGGIASLQIMGSYSCRTRNNRPGARLSEHAKGRALDIGGMVLRDGTVVSVLRHWGSNAYGAGLRQMHRAACGPFGTVLGPNANAAHRDHFHFDTARYRSGSYCR